MRMRAAVLEEFARPLVVTEVELAEPKAGEVLVRLVACGVCHTDLYTASGVDPSGYAPTVLGHEGAGVVEALGPVLQVWVVRVLGRELVSLALLPGECFTVKSRRPCVDRLELDDNEGAGAPIALGLECRLQVELAFRVVRGASARTEQLGFGANRVAPETGDGWLQSLELSQCGQLAHIGPARR